MGIDTDVIVKLEKSVETFTKLNKESIIHLVPTGWIPEQSRSSQAVRPYYSEETYSVSDKEGRSTWAEQIVRVYEMDLPYLWDILSQGFVTL